MKKAKMTYKVGIYASISNSPRFLNLFNERVSKQTHQKVRSAKTMLARKGEFLGAYAPYGYKKDSENRHHLVVDKMTAPVISRIFEIRRCVQSFRGIATTLNREGILSLRMVQCQRQGKEIPFRENGLWNESGVQSLIRNEVYIGNMVHNKRGTTTYRSRKLTAKEQEDWIRVENTHEAIINRET